MPFFPIFTRLENMPINLYIPMQQKCNRFIASFTINVVLKFSREFSA